MKYDHGDSCASCVLLQLVCVIPTPLSKGHSLAHPQCHGAQPGYIFAYSRKKLKTNYHNPLLTRFALSVASWMSICTRLLVDTSFSTRSLPVLCIPLNFFSIELSAFLASMRILIGDLLWAWRRFTCSSCTTWSLVQTTLLMHCLLTILRFSSSHSTSGS
jgi:hypothetical protein